MLNLSKALEIADKAIIYDNSTEAGHEKILLFESNQIVQSSGEIPQWITQSLSHKLFNSYNSRLRIVQEVYPTINSFKEKLSDSFMVTSPNVQKLEGSKYKIIIDNNLKELTLSAKDTINDLFDYNQSNNQVIFVSNINATDKSIWLNISQRFDLINDLATAMQLNF